MKHDLDHFHQELALNRFNKARQIIREVEKKDKYRGIFFNAILLYHQGKSERAVSLMKKLLEHNWREPELYYYLARVHLEWRDPVSALQHIDRAVELAGRQ